MLRLESRFERWRPAPKGGWREAGGAEEVGGLLYDLGSHLVDQAVRLLGPVREVYAESDVRRAGVAADDDTFIALTHAGGARSHLWVGAMTARLGPRFRVLGAPGRTSSTAWTYRRSGCARACRPLAAGFGDEGEERWGVAGTDADARPVPTEPGAYLDFYRAVAAACGPGAPPPVSAEACSRRWP